MRNTKVPSYVSHIITSIDAVASVTNYENFKTSLQECDASAAEAFPEFCCIELEKVEEYCQYIRREMEKQGIKSKGMKFIFAKHGHMLGASNPNPLYVDKVHIVLGPVDLQALANSNTESIDLPSESEAIKKVGLLNFMNIAPPYGAHIEVQDKGIKV